MKDLITLLIINTLLYFTFLKIWIVVPKVEREKVTIFSRFASWLLFIISMVLSIEGVIYYLNNNVLNRSLNRGILFISFAHLVWQFRIKKKSNVK
jgi:hypothetical protein